MKTNNSCDYIREVVKDVKPAMAYDGSMPLEQWQPMAYAKLQEMLGLPLVSCDTDYTVLQETKNEEYTRIDFEFQSEPGYYVPCTMLIPTGVNGPVPVAICLQGHSSGKHISYGEPLYPGDSIHGDRGIALQAVQQGFCAIALEQRYMGSCGQPAGEKRVAASACCGPFTAMASLLLGRTMIGERVWDISRLIDLIEERFADIIDPKKIICMGNSGGGTATFYAACMEPRIHLAIPSCSVCTFDASIMAMHHCNCNYIPGIRRYFNMGDLGCLIAPKRLVVVCGDEDPIFPLEGVKESFRVIQQGYKDAGKEDWCRLVIGKGGHRFFADDAWPVARELMDKAD